MIDGISIIVCAYNPNLAVFQRLIMALANFRFPKAIPIEFIFIDNNSSPLMDTTVPLKAFLEKNLNAKCIVEEIQGLTAARIKATKVARYSWLIFFDDDNEPNVDYLVNLVEAITIYPKVYCWGPAKISVEYLGVPENDWVQLKKGFFQERNWERTSFDISPIWQACFPYGTGLVANKLVLAEFVKRVENGRYSLTDRKGKSLISGGDVQIVLTATDLGFAAGTIKGLSVNHLTARYKATIGYLERQVYGTASSYVAAHKQVNSSIEIDEHLANNIQIVKRFLRKVKTSIFRVSWKDFRLSTADLMGAINARYVYTKINKPFVLRIYEKIIGA